jgi:hypothetical protein
MRRLLPLLLAAVSQGASANPSSFALHSVHTGPGNCLDIVNADQRDQLRMTRCGTYSGQMWSSPIRTPTSFQNWLIFWLI